MDLVLKPCKEDYESLLINEELDRVKFSLSDQYQHKYNSSDNIYSENANGLSKLVVKYIPYRGISLSNPYRNHHLHSQLIW